MSELSWAALTQLIHERADYCCEYCQACQKVVGQPMHMEHIDPAGGDYPDNLCLACASCNLSKAKVTRAPDPQNGEVVSLFNPRNQNWREHFVWIDGGLRIQGLTPIGRATIARLKMNQERFVIARSWWIKAKCHPPRLKT